MQSATYPKRFNYFLLGIAGLLLIPLVAMQFTNEVSWSVGDFLIMGGLLLLVALGLEAILRTIKSSGSRLVFIILTVAIFLLVWAELAVGIFGTPLAGS